jgi:hypothetical protein
MLIQLALGSLMIVANLAIQVLAVVLLLRMLMHKMNSGGFTPGLIADFRIISSILMVLFVGHILQFSSWALLFLLLGEFADFATAFYHSTVNFTSLGYGDIVMSDRWRLLGALEAANGVLMFGLTAGTTLSVMARLLDRAVKNNS